MIASRESQYKILHFHHAGLDKLAEVFQQWKCCRETQLKDQVGLQPKFPVWLLVLLEKEGIFFNNFYSVAVFLPMCFSPLVSFNIRCQMRSLACSFPSRGPPCHRPRLTQKRGFIEGWMSPLGYVTSTRTDRWRRSISCARYVCRCEHKQAIIILRNQSEGNQSANMLSSIIPIRTVSITFSGSTCFGKSFWNSALHCLKFQFESALTGCKWWEDWSWPLSPCDSFQSSLIDSV